LSDQLDGVEKEFCDKWKVTTDAPALKRPSLPVTRQHNAARFLRLVIAQPSPTAGGEALAEKPAAQVERREVRVTCGEHDSPFR